MSHKLYGTENEIILTQVDATKALSFSLYVYNNKARQAVLRSNYQVGSSVDQWSLDEMTK